MSDHGLNDKSTIKITQIPGLDGLRGIAIILVMLHHFALYGWQTRPVNRLELLIKCVSLSGWVGVDLFFVLSGFLITRILISTKGHPDYYKNFYVRRFLRIFPPYYGFLFIFLIVIPNIFTVDRQYQALLNDQIWYWTYLTNIQLGIQGVPEFFAIAHFWSLAIEEQFYIVWPLPVKFLREKSLFIACGCLMGCSLLFRFVVGDHFFPVPYILTPARMDALALGGLLAIIERRQIPAKTLSYGIWSTLTLSGISILLLSIPNRLLVIDNDAVKTYGLTIIIVFFASLILLVITYQDNRWIKILFSNRILRFFGKYSYSLYIIHHIVAIFAPQWGFSVETIPVFTGSDLLRFILFSLVLAALSTSVALLSWHGLEKRFLRLKDNFNY